MATDEERALILAEYMQAADNGDDDEEEFDGEDNYFDDDDDDDSNGYDEDYGDSDDDDDLTEKQDENYSVLQGSLNINEEGRVVYSGTWIMKKDLDAQQKLKSNGTSRTKAKGDEKMSKNGKDDKKKKKTKFKLKSKQVVSRDNDSRSASKGRDRFLLNPVSSSSKSRSLLFDGFFVTDETDKQQPYRKIKERDVEITFSRLVAQTGDDAEKVEGDESSSASQFQVRGVGCNEYGNFQMEGIYTPKASSSSPPTTSESQDTTAVVEASGDKIGTRTDVDSFFSLTCNKRYVEASKQVGKGKKRKRRNAGDYDSENEEISDDEGADFNELIGLHEEAGMSVEELRLRYYGKDGGDEGDERNGNDVADGNGKPLPVKRSKSNDFEDDGDGCGF